MDEQTQVLDAGTSLATTAQGERDAPPPAAPEVPLGGPVSVPTEFVHAMTDGLLARWLPAPKQVVTNVSSDSEEGKSFLSRMMTKGELDKDSFLDKAFPAYGYLIHEVELPDMQTGELKAGVRMCFIDRAGTTLDTCSGPCLDGLRSILALYQGGPWEPPIPIRFRKMPSRNFKGGHYYVLYAEQRKLPENDRTK